MTMAFRFIFWSLVLGGLCAAQDALTTLSYNFTLAAWNTNMTNSNSTGAPLVLGSSGQSNGIIPHLTSTYASTPYNEYPFLGLVNGTLRAASAADGGWRTNATKVGSGDPLIWLTTSLYSTNGSSAIYSSVKTANHSSLLAAYGFYDLWSLCPLRAYNKTGVVFNVSETPPDKGYDPEQCYSVLINILPTS